MQSVHFIGNELEVRRVLQGQEAREEIDDIRRPFTATAAAAGSGLIAALSFRYAVRISYSRVRLTPNRAEALVASSEPLLKSLRIVLTNPGGRRWTSCFFSSRQHPTHLVSVAMPQTGGSAPTPRSEFIALGQWA